MAFISGTNVRYECPICGLECEDEMQSDGNAIWFVYSHGNNIQMVNGYPMPCENNGKILEETEVITIKSPRIETFGITHPGRFGG